MQSTSNLSFVVDKADKLKEIRTDKKNSKDYSSADNAMIKVINSMPASRLFHLKNKLLPLFF